ncbi:MAG: FmdB family zinc ribbon protein [Nitrospinota bacterium]
MPLYEFECKKCRTTFCLCLSIEDYDKKRYACPKCKLKEVKRLVSTFQTKTSKKS